MPIDLCVSMTGRTQSSGNESALRPSTTLPMIRMAMTQWSSIAVRVYCEGVSKPASALRVELACVFIGGFVRICRCR